MTIDKKQSTLPAALEFSPEQRVGLREGDRGALAALFDLYFDRIYNYVRRLVREDHLAEDLTQEVFLQVHRFRERYDPERDPRAWLFTIATNQVRSTWRSRQRRPEGHELSLDLESASVARTASPETAPETPEGVVSENDQLERTRAVVEDLPRSMRITVLLRAYEELSFAAIAEMLEISELACRKRYSRALAELRRRLSPNPDPVEMIQATPRTTDP